jgi:hypothetical protein
MQLTVQLPSTCNEIKQRTKSIPTTKTILEKLYDRNYQLQMIVVVDETNPFNTNVKSFVMVGLFLKLSNELWLQATKLFLDF